MVGSDVLTGGLAAVRAAPAKAEPAMSERAPAMATSNNGIRLIECLLVGGSLETVGPVVPAPASNHDLIYTTCVSGM